jgi:hypothetical protein
MTTAELDNAVRLHIYQRFVATAAPPTVTETAGELARPADEIAESYRRLEQARVIVLAPGTLNVWLANPLCASPSPFHVETPRGEFWGICAWDALGVVAMLGGEGRVRTHCPDCNEPMTFRVKRRELETPDGVAHFVVPARHWWDNIAFT